MKLSRGDVVLVDYPFSDRTGSKVRPALIVQADHLNHRISDTILAAITRSTHRASTTQFFIDISTPDGIQTGLRQNSMIQCENLLTFDQRLVITKIGEATTGRLTPPARRQRRAARVSVPVSYDDVGSYLIRDPKKEGGSAANKKR